MIINGHLVTLKQSSMSTATSNDADHILPTSKKSSLEEIIDKVEAGVPLTDLELVAAIFFYRTTERHLRFLGKAFSHARSDIGNTLEVLERYHEARKQSGKKHIRSAGTIDIGRDGLCKCGCADPCPLGKTGSAVRCSQYELESKGFHTRSTLD